MNIIYIIVRAVCIGISQHPEAQRWLLASDCYGRPLGRRVSMQCIRGYDLAGRERRKGWCGLANLIVV